MTALRQSLNSSLLNNVLWFMASLLVAFLVWFIATTASDPIIERTFSSISVQMQTPDGLIVTGDVVRTVTVVVRAQESLFSQFNRQEIVVSADLNSTEPGEQSIPLQARIIQPDQESVLNYVAYTNPRQIPVMLEQVERSQKPVEITVSNQPPADVTFETPQPDARQVEVSGASSKVNNVVAVRGEIDLTNQRNLVVRDVALYAVDAAGNRVQDVTIAPQSTSVSVNIYQRDGVSRVSISPRIRFETLPPGYYVSTLVYEPQTIFVSGAQGELDDIEDTFSTEPIDLTGRTSDVEVVVPIQLPQDNLLILNGQNVVTVTIGIEAQTTVLQIDEVPIDIIGLSSEYTAETVPETVSVVLKGPVAVLDGLESRDVQAVLDLESLGPNSYELIPDVLIRQGQITVDSVTLLPSTIDVTITGPDAPAEATESPG